MTYESTLMSGNTNLNNLMSMFSGLGAGGGLGVPSAPNG
jgi:ubiquilin